MTSEKLVEKFKRLTDENKVKALARLEQLIARQGKHPASPCSPGTGEQPVT